MKKFFFLCAGRAGTCLGTMAFAGALPVTRNEWNLDASSAGSIQTVFSISNAVALLAASWLSDYYGARRVYLVFSWLGVLALIAFACLARSYSSAVVLMAVIGLTQGGAYTPAMILAMKMNSLTKRGFAVGAILAAGSLGYLLSVFISSFGALKWGTSVAFYLCAAGALAGAIAGSVSLSNYKEDISRFRKLEKNSAARGFSLASLCLLAGYIAHSWELLGNWAWSPSMVMLSLSTLHLSPLTGSIIVASVIHLSGMFSTIITGAISDYFNRYAVLIFMGAAGAVSSFLMGLSFSWGVEWTLSIVFIGSFFILGDSGVLSAALADNVPAHRLGSMLGLRSLLGFGIGSFSPLSMGKVLDITHSWGLAYLVIAAGGGLACISAIALRMSNRYSMTDHATG